MENIIAKLLQDFEQGKMSRRQLIQSLALAATAASATVAAPPAEAADTGLKAININHISFHVPDYTKMRDFYSGLFGMRVWDETKVGPSASGRCSLLCGSTNINVSNNAPNMNPEPHFDHMALEIEKYDQKVVLAELKRRGIPLADASQIETFRNGGEIKVKDPAGFTLQISPKGYAQCCTTRPR